MAALHIRDIPEYVVAALKRRAARNERSLQRELRHVLTQIAAEEGPPESLPPLQLILSKTKPAGSWRREEIYDDGER